MAAKPMNAASMAATISLDIPLTPLNSPSRQPIGMGSWPKSDRTPPIPGPAFPLSMGAARACLMDTLKLAIAGAAGRMGRTLTRVAHETPGIVVAGGLEAPQSPHLGTDLGALAGIGPIGVTVTAEAPALLAGVDAIVDFTTPAAS